MQIRQLAIVVAASAAISASIGFGLSQASQPDAAVAGGGKAQVRELKKITKELKTVNDRIGYSTFDIGSVRGLLDDIEGNTR